MKDILMKKRQQQLNNIRKEQRLTILSKIRYTDITSLIKSQVDIIRCISSIEGLQELSNWTGQDFKFQLSNGTVMLLCKQLIINYTKPNTKRLLLIIIGNICLQKQSYKQIVFTICFKQIFTQLFQGDLSLNKQNQWRLLIVMLPLSQRIIQPKLSENLFLLISKTINFKANFFISIIAFKRILLATIRIQPYQNILILIENTLFKHLQAFVYGQGSDQDIIKIIQSFSIMYSLSNLKLSRHLFISQLFFQLLQLNKYKISAALLQLINKDGSLNLDIEILKCALNTIKDAGCRHGLTNLLYRFIQAGKVTPCVQLLQLLQILLEDDRADILLKGIKIAQWLYYNLQTHKIEQKIGRLLQNLMRYQNKYVCNQAEKMLQLIYGQQICQ